MKLEFLQDILSMPPHETTTHSLTLSLAMFSCALDNIIPSRYSLYATTRNYNSLSLDILFRTTKFNFLHDIYLLYPSANNNSLKNIYFLLNI